MKRFFSTKILALFALPLASCTLIIGGGGDDIAFCGDGTLQTGELCDDGNTSNGDGCRADCNGEELCGDGITDTEAGVPEACDDGNTDGGDGCSDDCRRIEECGNGFVDADEECDDGNGSNGNGSTDTCDSNCSNTACGNGILTTATGEECDDDNNTNGDGCSSSCIIEECGNNIADPGEQCDDGNGVNGDGCDIDCSNTACGNGVVTIGEQCDDGNAVEGDGCDTNCTPPACGNNIADDDEACDDGNAISGDGCDANCSVTDCGNNIVTAGEQCDDGNNIDNDGCTNACLQPNCGNNIVEIAFNEQCDDGNLLNNDGCDGNCTLPNCGNGVQNAGEQCDDGNATDNDGCRNDCQNPDCGDGVVQLSNNEICDDGNTVSGDGCNATCSRVEECGNGFIDLVGESCDDGDNVANDGCDSVCQIESCGDGVINFDLSLNRLDQCDDDNNIGGDGCSSVCLVEVCGNNIVDPGEACDDGGTQSGDGCRGDCEGFELCGDGLEDAGEGCDDANAIDGDGCDNNCTATSCGNGIVAGNEVCDDGGSASGDGCAANCLSDESCGNNIVDDGELCDDGNIVSGDGCRNDCNKLEICGDGVLDFQDVNQNAQFDAGEGEECDDGNTDTDDECPSGSNGTCRVASCGDGFTQTVIEDCDDANGDELDGCNTICTLPACNNGIGEVGEFCIEDPTSITAALVFHMVSTDINNDGRLDIVSCDAGPFLRVFINDGTTFNQSQALAMDAGSNGCHIAIADIDGNSTPDVVVHNTAVNTYNVFINNGNILQAGVGFASLGQTGDSVFADTNDDGNADLIATLNTGVAIYRGNGNATFQAPQVLSTSTFNVGLDAADLNSDGKDDLVTGNGPTLRIFLSNAFGGFDLTEKSVQGGGNNRGTKLVDLDKDGQLDVLYLNESFPAFFFFRGVGAGIFQNQVDSPITTVLATQFTLGDFNNDQNLDALIVDSKNGAADDLLTMMLGQGDGTFVQKQSIAIDDFAIAELVAGDFDQDGNLDAASGATFAGVKTFVGNGDGTLRARDVLPRVATFNASLSVSGDFDEDGDLDLLAAGNNSIGLGKTQVYLNQGVNFSVGQNIEGSVSDIAVGDLDNDGHLDVLFAGNNVRASFGNGDGTFQAPAVIGLNGGETQPFNVVLGDLNNDNDLDIVISTFGNVGAAGFFIFQNTGGRTFSAPFNLADPAIVNLSDVTLADMNEDGDLDLIGTNISSAQSFVAFGNGDGTFVSLSSRVVIDAGVSVIRSPRAVDINGDGHLDVVAVASANQLIRAMLGNGDGTFQAQFTLFSFLDLAEFISPTSIEFGDFNNDGIATDILIGHQSTTENRSPMFLSNGDGTYQGKTQITSGTKPFFPHVVDLDGDGGLEMIFCNVNNSNDLDTISIVRSNN